MSKMIHPIHRLPFVGKRGQFSDVCADFWAVPATGGYRGGCATGSAFAHLYLMYLRDHPNEEAALQNIALDMQRNATRGQMVGFFSTLAPALQQGAQHQDSYYPASEADLMARATAGIHRPLEEYEQ